MRCQCCRSEFTISRFTSVRQSRGTGGSSPPQVMGVALLALTLASLTLAATLQLAGMTLALRLSTIPIALAWCTTFGAWLTSYQDAHIVICPRCRTFAGTRWPWTR